MKKQILSLTLALALTAGGAAAVTAEDKTPAVFVNSSEIIFDDQSAVILNDRTLVPARGVFEAMGADVQWDGEQRLVKVTSADNKTSVELIIDDSTMKVYDLSGMFAAVLSGQTFEAPETPVTLDVAPQILNDRTMIPLRAISEAMGADVQWDGDNYVVSITSKDAPADKTAVPAFYLSAPSMTAKEGETVDLYINVKNLPADMFVSGVTAAVKYDEESFEFVEASLVNGENKIEDSVGSSTKIDIGMVKSVYITINSEAAVKEDGAVMKLTFKSLNGKEGAFAISDTYNTADGFNTLLTADKMPVDGKYSDSLEYSGDTFFIDTAEVVINGKDAEEASPAPEASEAPEATAAPEASEAPEATDAPEASESPEATAAPEASEAPEATAEPTAAPAA